MKHLFYIISFLLFAPIGLYSLIQNRIKNYYYQQILFVVFLLKSFIDLFLWYILIFEIDSFFIKFIFILLIIILLVNYIKYISNFNVETNSILKKLSKIKITKNTSKDKNTDSNFNSSKVSVKRDNYNDVFISSNTSDNNYLSNERICTNNIPNTFTSSSYYSYRDEWKDSTLRKKIKNFHKQQYPIIEEINAYIGTGEIYKFLYKKTDYEEPDLRQVVVEEVFVSRDKIYMECFDIEDNNIRKTFRIDKMDSIFKIIKNLSEEEIKDMKNKFESLSKSKKIIENTNEIIAKLTTEINLSTEIGNDIMDNVMKNNGFILKKGKTCSFYNEKFEYVGTKSLNIKQLKGIFSNMYSIPSFGKVEYYKETNYTRRTKNYELYTYSEEMVYLLNNYDPEVYYELKDKINFLNILNKT